MIRLPRYLWFTFAAGVFGTVAISLFAVRSQLTLRSIIEVIVLVIWAVGYFFVRLLLAETKDTMSSSNYKVTDAFRRQFIRFSSAIAALLIFSGLVAISISAIFTNLRQEFLIVGIGTCVFGAYWLWLARKAKAEIN